jgi:hypothetical protein
MFSTSVQFKLVTPLLRQHTWYDSIQQLCTPNWSRYGQLRVYPTQNTGLFYLSSENLKGNVNYSVNTPSIANEMLWQHSLPVYTSLLVSLSFELNTKIAQTEELQYARRYIQNSISCSVTKCNIQKWTQGNRSKNDREAKITFYIINELVYLRCSFDWKSEDRDSTPVFHVNNNRIWFHHLHISHTNLAHYTNGMSISYAVK